MSTFRINIPENKNQKTNKEKKDFSLSMVVLAWAHFIAGVVAIFTIVMCACSGNLDPLAYLIPAVFVDAAAVTAVVLWKRKHENVIAFLSNKKFKAAIEWLKEKDVDPAEFIRVLKE